MNRTAWLQDRRMQKFRDVLSRWGAVGARGWRDTRGVGAAVPALPAALRGGWRCRARRPTAWQGIGSARPGRQDRLDARSIPDASHWLEREAFPRAHSRAAWVSVGLHLDQNTAAYGEAGGARGAPRGASSQTAAQACEGMMLHQDGSRFAWLGGFPQLDLIVSELAPIVHQLALWRDRFTPPPGEESDVLARHPGPCRLCCAELETLERAFAWIRRLASKSAAAS
jgi:hypothetical protein